MLPTGQFPPMEKELSVWVDDTRDAGIPVEVFMLEMEGRRILEKLYLKPGCSAATRQLVEEFKFSEGWRFVRSL